MAFTQVKLMARTDKHPDWRKRQTFTHGEPEALYAQAQRAMVAWHAIDVTVEFKIIIEQPYHE